VLVKEQQCRQSLVLSGRGDVLLDGQVRQKTVDVAFGQLARMRPGVKNDEAANPVKGIDTGKTFLVTCFAGAVGIPAVSLKNLLGDRSSSGDSGVSNRVFAQIAAFMGNTELRGKVIWFLQEHIALFYPDTDEERLALLRAMQKKTGTQVASPEAEKFFLERAAGLSGADIEAVLIRARLKSALSTEIELQNLAAVRECTSRSLLPEQYRNMDRAELIRRANELAALAGGGS
jgi:hypothetical protein